MEKIKVLHIIKSLGRGGAEMLLPETLKVHDQSRFQFTYVYFLPWKNQMVEALKRGGGNVLCFGAGNNLQVMTKMFALARFARKNKIEIIHAHLPWAGVVARFVGRLTGIPVVYTEHNKQERYHWITRRMNLLTFPMQHLTLAVSEDVANSIRKHKPEVSARVRTQLNGVNTAFFNREEMSGAAVRQRFGIPEDAIVIGTVAVFRDQKRLDVWLQVAEAILRSNPKMHFVIVGDGPLKETLLLQRERLGLQERVHMPGLQTEVREFLAAFDIFMMTSKFEGLPIALLEAMSMGCAIVSTDAGGIGEVVRHEKEGLVCSVDKPLELIQYAERLLNDPAFRRTLGSNARNRVLQQFGIQKMADALETIYEDITKQTHT
jgi:glycosyltransferase involved in cell wall biosynthesis